MKKLLTLIGITSTLAVGAVDASSFNLAPLPEQASNIAGNRVSVKQTGNVVETTLPWKDQSGIKVKYDMGTTTALENLNDKRDAQVVTELVDFGDGGFKVDVLLNKKPKTNEFCYEIEGAENYDFFYQPALTQEEVDNGAERPENIVGSYAVYHKSLKNNEYQTGKVMHIPRPQVWEVNDKASTTVWAELSYTEPNLCVTVDQAYLNKAKYPVRVDPTFGYTSVGGSTTFIASQITGNSSRKGYGATLSESGTVTSISTNLVTSSGNETVDVSVFINTEDSGGVGSHDEVLSVERTSLSVTNTKTWYEFTPSATAISPDNYVLSTSGDGSDPVSANVNISYDVSIGETRYDEIFGTYAATKEDPWTVSDTANLNYSTYATYTASATEATTTPRITLEGGVGLEGDVIIQ